MLEHFIEGSALTFHRGEVLEQFIEREMLEHVIEGSAQRFKCLNMFEIGTKSRLNMQ